MCIKFVRTITIVFNRYNCDAHIAGHKENRGKPKPEYIINSEGGLYEVKTVKESAK